MNLNPVIFPDPRWGIANCIRRIMQSRKQCAWCLSTGHVHAVVAATVGVVGKELIGCKFNVSGCCGAVRHRITPAIDDVLRPAASGEKTELCLFGGVLLTPRARGPRHYSINPWASRALTGRASYSRRPSSEIDRLAAKGRGIWAVRSRRQYL